MAASYGTGLKVTPPLPGQGAAPRHIDVDRGGAGALQPRISGRASRRDPSQGTRSTSFLVSPQAVYNPHMAPVNDRATTGGSYPLKVLLQTTDQAVELAEVAISDCQHSAAAFRSNPDLETQVRGKSLLQLLDVWIGDRAGPPIRPLARRLRRTSASVSRTLRLPSMISWARRSACGHPIRARAWPAREAAVLRP